MPSNLRLIAVHVEEAGSRRFTWVLTERIGSRWDDLQQAEDPVDTYHLAMADGLLALQALIADLDAGPRAEPAGSDDAAVTDENADPAAEDPEPAAAMPKRGLPFGFGPAR